MRIGINFDYNAKGVRQAMKGLGGLKHSALTTGAVVGSLTTAFVALGRAGVAAAMDDAKAMQRLNAVLTNMGFATQTTQVEDFISSMESVTGVLDDQLRPAYQQLLQVSGDAAAAQSLLQTSMDIAAGTGSDLATVTGKLTKVLAGQRKGLVSLGLGISATEAKTISLNDVLAIATERFGGMSEAIAQTDAGKLQRINTAFDNLKETIGYGFLAGLGNTTDKTNKFIDAINAEAVGLGLLFGKVASGISKITDGIDWVLGKLNLLNEQLVGASKFYATWNAQLETMINKRISEIQLQKSLKKLEADRLKAEREKAKLAAQQQAQKAKEAAAAKALSDLQKKFDLDRIAIYAASQKNITQQERERLTAMMTLNEVQYSDELTWQDKILASLEKLNAAQQDAAKKAADTAAAAKTINNASLSAITQATKILGDTNLSTADKASALAKLLAGLDSATLAAVAGQFGTLGVSILANSNSVIGLTKLLEGLDNTSLNKILEAVIGVSAAEIAARGAIDATTQAIINQGNAAVATANALNQQAAAAAAAANASSDAASKLAADAAAKAAADAAAKAAADVLSAKAAADAAAAAVAAAAAAAAKAAKLIPGVSVPDLTGNGGGGNGSSLAQLPPTGNTITVPHGAIVDTGEANSGNGNSGGTVVNLTVTGSVIAQQDLVAAVGNAVNQFARVGGKLVPLG